VGLGYTYFSLKEKKNALEAWQKAEAIGFDKMKIETLEDFRWEL